MTPPRILWPDGKKFAFTIFDDTDAATVEKLKPVYDFLLEHGMRTTKSVWPLAGTEPPAVVGGLTCDDGPYLEWVRSLQRAGVEIGFHNATFHSSPRERTRAGLDRFRELFGHDPRSMANHTTNREGIYWGDARVGGWRRALYTLLTRGRNRGWFRGHVEGDGYFWGDLCRERVHYVRNFVFDEMNTLAACPWMPYADAERPFVNQFYASSEGGWVDTFVHTIREEQQDRLEAEGGACIMYTHLAKKFCVDGKLDARFQRLIERLAAKDGWFVPVSTLLDHIAQQRGPHMITNAQRAALERRWLWRKLRTGTS